MANATESVADVDHYELGRTLFDAGYYWEAHEAWEHRWIELGRRGPQADCVKGLIKLAAAGVKVLAGQQDGAVRHATRCVELLQTASTVSAVRPTDQMAALQIAELYRQRPFTRVDADPWQPTPLEAWQLRPC